MTIKCNKLFTTIACFAWFASTEIMIHFPLFYFPLSSFVIVAAVLKIPRAATFEKQPTSFQIANSFCNRWLFKLVLEKENVSLTIVCSAPILKWKTVVFCSSYYKKYHIVMWKSLCLVVFVIVCCCTIFKKKGTVQAYKKLRWKSLSELVC